MLDTPLLTYREPLKSKHGDLSDDEKPPKETSLAEKFYKHLASLAEKLQVTVIENSYRPAAIEGLAYFEVFTRLSATDVMGFLSAILVDV